MSSLISQFPPHLMLPKCQFLLVPLNTSHSFATVLVFHCPETRLSLCLHQDELLGWFRLGWVPSTRLLEHCPLESNTLCIFQHESEGCWLMVIVDLQNYTVPGPEVLNRIEWCVLYLLLLSSGSPWFSTRSHCVRKQELYSGIGVITLLSAPTLVRKQRQTVKVYFNRISTVRRLEMIPFQCFTHWPKMLTYAIDSVSPKT